MRKKIVAGNWKMNLLAKEARDLHSSVVDGIGSEIEAEMIVFPPSLFLCELAKNKSGLLIGAQNFYPAESGAYTGEVSVTQIKDCGASHVLIGHSERREILKESDTFIKTKVDVALKHEMKIVFCCGESLEIRESGNEMKFVRQQLMDGLFHLSTDELRNCAIAYEPIWAIGTGKTASVDQAEEMHRSIRSWIRDHYSEEVAESISILYGGSCNPSNAKELFACPNVDGGLIGGASLQAESFLQIAKSF